MAFTGTIIVGLIIVIIIIFCGGYMVGIYNSLVQVRNNIEKAWKNIDVLLLQRHDELIKLIVAVKGYMEHEKELLERLTKLRVGYNQTDSIEEKTRIENQINRETLRMHHVWEGYPDIKASQNFLQFQERISGIESQIADRREFFNDTVNIYNIQIERFPELILARVLGYKRRSLLEIPENLKQDVKIEL